MGKAIFVTGIDTNIGKSYATGYIANEYAAQGYSVITQKFIQTGNIGISEDIIIHRKIMGMELLPEDINGTTCPIVLSYPASPHLAALIDEVQIDMNKIKAATCALRRKYNMTIIEGAGGIMTPITGNYTTLDYIRDCRLPVIVVTTPRLGSINHTLLTLEMCKHAGIRVAGMVYNKFSADDDIICDDTRRYLQNYLTKRFPHAQMYECGYIRI